MNPTGVISWICWTELCAHAPLTLIYVTHLAEEIRDCVTHQLRLERGETSFSAS